MVQTQLSQMGAAEFDSHDLIVCSYQLAQLQYEQTGSVALLHTWYRFTRDLDTLDFLPFQRKEKKKAWHHLTSPQGVFFLLWVAAGLPATCECSTI